MSSSGQVADIPSGVTQDDNYVSRSGEKNGPVPVQSDNAPVGGVDEDVADSDAQLERDEKEAIDQDNIVGARTRGAKPSGGYREPGDEEGLPIDDGSSSV